MPLSILSMFAGGFHALEEIKHKLPKGELDIHCLMIAVAIGTAAISAWSEKRARVSPILILVIRIFRASSPLSDPKSCRQRLFQEDPKNRTRGTTER